MTWPNYEETKYAPTYGVVCLIDALGAKNFSDEETINFLESRKVIRRAMEDKVADQINIRSIQNPKIALFNDTIVVAIECRPDSEEEKNSIYAIAVIVRKLISDGISKGIFFRGAIGVGNFFADLPNDTIIGQAVSDAASWYESSNFIGCILTPRLAFVLQKHFGEGQPTARGTFIPHLISTKEGNKEMFCVNWPRAFFISSIRPAGCEEGRELQYLYKKFGECYFPKVADEKFLNTVEFFKASCVRAEKT
ncbi:MAG TPA: hypothetical protein VG347_02275 [Verrucomicrobiae bacterium]|nr:hypothetical protein [Verrucomicrobiae bacterium]